MKPIKCPHCKKIFFDIGSTTCPFCKKNLQITKDDLESFTKIFGNNNPF